MQIYNYKITTLLGEGGMAKVYLANDAKFDTNVAVKLLNKEYIHNENIRKRFLAEAKSMFRMSHPNVIKVTDLIDEQDTVAFVMEFVEGETLKEYIDRKRKLTDEEIVSVFSQMLDAVGYVHSQKLVHRDIKPSNFMVTPSGNVKLMDFGIAKNTDETSMEYTQTGTGMQMGTPMYMSPEQIRNTSEVTQSSDIYSLGIVLWQMVTGTKPYDTKTISSFDLQTKIVTENLPRTNTRWDVIIEKATSKELEGRYQNITLFKDSLTNNSSNNITDKLLNTDSEKTVIETSSSNTKKTQITTKETKSEAQEKQNGNNTLNKKKKTSFKMLIISFLAVIIVTLVCFYLYDKNSTLDIQSGGNNMNESSVEVDQNVVDEELEDYKKDNLNKTTDNNNETQITQDEKIDEYSSNVQGEYPEASLRLLYPEDLMNLSAFELKIMRNEIFARHGYIFKTPEMKSYFLNQYWFEGRYNNVDNQLTKIEKENILLIKSYE